MAAKWTRQIYKTDTGAEMIELQRGESVNLNYALLSGRTTVEEVSALRKAMKDEARNA